jgi:uncharacterized protein (AIM24 family)
MKPDSGVSVTQRLVLPPPPVLSASPAGGPQSPSMAAPSLLALPIGRTIAMSSDGVLLVQTGGEPSQAFAGRLEALRVLSGSVTARVLHRRSREGETMEVMGRLGSPIVRLAGAGQLVFGPRPGRRIVLLALERDPAFLREDLLLGFELTLAFENGRIALEAAGESGRPPGEAGATALVQLRGAGAFALELEGQLASVRTSPGRPLLVRREWIVGWLGRLVARAVPSDESPSGQRGLVAFSGDGTVLVTPS